MFNLHIKKTPFFLFPSFWHFWIWLSISSRRSSKVAPQVKGNMTYIQPCKCILLYHIYTPHISLSACRHVYKISQVKKKHAWCFSNAFQGILSGDSASFRSSGSALGVAGAQLCQVQLWEVDSRKTCVTLIIWCKLQLPHPFLCNSTALHMNIWMHAHILWAQGFWHTQTCWQFQEFGNCLMPPVKQVDCLMWHMHTDSTNAPKAYTRIPQLCSRSVRCHYWSISSQYLQVLGFTEGTRHLYVNFGTVWEEWMEPYQSSHQWYSMWKHSKTDCYSVWETAPGLQC